MVLGSGFFVTPSDSVAIIAANAQDAIPYFRNGPKVRKIVLCMFLSYFFTGRPSILTFKSLFYSVRVLRGQCRRAEPLIVLQKS